jgi:hypothetical protein
VTTSRRLSRSSAAQRVGRVEPRIRRRSARSRRRPPAVACVHEGRRGLAPKAATASMRHPRSRPETGREAEAEPRFEGSSDAQQPIGPSQPHHETDRGPDEESIRNRRTPVE